jgi:tetratricopeptide (TPR) repeat protein
MHRANRIPAALAVVGLIVAQCALFIPHSRAQTDHWEWPEKPENLKVLPKDWTGKQLRPVMRGFTRALGVRCSHCHVGEEGKPLSTYDFASDDNPKKDVARTMLKMLGTINDHLDDIEPSGPKRVNMWCHTCHRGRPRPMTLAEELEEKHTQDGWEAAVGYYRTLREKFYGHGAYDFSEPVLNQMGYQVLGRDDAEGAITLFKLNVEMYPESANVYDSLAEAYAKVGMKELAIKNYEESLRRDPDNKNAKQKLQELSGEGD